MRKRTHQNIGPVGAEHLERKKDQRLVRDQHSNSLVRGNKGTNLKNTQNKLDR